MRDEIEALRTLGPLPDEGADEAQIATYEELLNRISAPISDEEAVALLPLFGIDDCYGLSWTMLHLIESAPGWPLVSALHDGSNEWIQRLKHRAGIKTNGTDDFE
jgi:hypothetical protein